MISELDKQAEIWHSHGTPEPLGFVQFHPGEITSTQS